jgi:dihydrolipoamide dehydrogenase
MFDIIVVGGGPGGYAAAIRAAQLGGTVAVVESDQIGGTCVNRGCIPSKTWLRAAALLQQIKKADVFGIDAQVNTVNLKTLCERTAGVTGDIRMGMEGILGSNRIKVIKGRAVLKTPGLIDVDGTVYDTRKIIIATGSRLTVPDIPGVESAAMTTNEVFKMETLPESVLIIGGRTIETEMATLLAHLGCRVVLATEDARILPQEDRDSSQRVGQAMRAEGIEIISRCKFLSIAKTGKTCTCELSEPAARTVESEAVLIGMRKPNTRHMGFEGIGIDIDENGVVCVDDRLQTNIGGIYAIGDAVGGWMLSHAASAMGIVAAENAMGKTAAFNADRVPRGIWTSPEVGAVGLSEEDAEARGHDIEVGDFPFSINGLAMARNQISGAVKIVSDARYGKILGVHAVGACATEIIGEAVLAMEMEATVTELSKSIRVHPTFSETMVECARDAAQWALYLPANR